MFSWFSDWIQKVQKYVNLVDIVKSFLTSVPFVLNFVFKLDSNSNEYLLVKIGFGTAENASLKV